MVEFRVENVANNPNLTFVFFVGLTILAVLGLRFAFYAHRNRVGTAVGAHSTIWRSLQYIGLLATVYGLAGVLEIVSTLELPAKNAVLLGMTLLLAFAIRRIHRTVTWADGEDRIPAFERLVRATFVGLVAVDLAVVSVSGPSALTAALEGASAVAFLAYGVAFFHDQTSQARVQGTMLDSLVRHLLPVLTFASLVSVVSLAIPVGLDRAVVLHVQVVFIIMTATALMTGTIKLRQNLAGL